MNEDNLKRVFDETAQAPEPEALHRVARFSAQLSPPVRRRLRLWWALAPVAIGVLTSGVFYVYSARSAPDSEQVTYIESAGYGLDILCPPEDPEGLRVWMKQTEQLLEGRP